MLKAFTKTNEQLSAVKSKPELKDKLKMENFPLTFTLVKEMSEKVFLFFLFFLHKIVIFLCESA